jgi:hypothetical protein
VIVNSKREISARPAGEVSAARPLDTCATASTGPRRRLSGAGYLVVRCARTLSLSDAVELTP